MAEEKTSVPTQAQIDAWKKQYKTVHKLTVEDKVGYLHNPDRRTLSLAMSRISRGDIMGGSEAVLENCWLGGDEEIKTDDELFMGAISVVGEIISAKQAALEKL